MAEGEEVLVLRDGAGQHYLLPVKFLDAHRLSGEDFTRLEAALGEADVAGFVDFASGAIPTTNFAILGSMPRGDIEALAFLVMMNAAKSAQEDVRAIMQGVKAQNHRDHP